MKTRNSKLRDSWRCLITISSVGFAVCSVSLFQYVMLLGNAAALFQFLCSERVGEPRQLQGLLQTDQLWEKGKQVIWAKPKAAEGGRADGLQTSSDPLAEPSLSHTGGAFSPPKGRQRDGTGSRGLCTSDCRLLTVPRRAGASNTRVFIRCHVCVLLCWYIKYRKTPKEDQSMI